LQLQAYNIAKPKTQTGIAVAHNQAYHYQASRKEGNLIPHFIFDKTRYLSNSDLPESSNAIRNMCQDCLDNETNMVTLYHSLKTVVHNLADILGSKKLVHDCGHKSQ
jgi:hypothetical protein